MLFRSHETVMCMKVLNLEVSEHTHARLPLLCVGTAVSQGEDLPIRGRVYVFSIIRVVPYPGKPETRTALKLLAKEEIPRGAVTALSEIGTQGFLVIGQGQKAMVRGLKEDGTLLPVAFMDMGTYVTDIKTVPGTGIVSFADAVKGAWLVGYGEEPYKMISLGKQGGQMEVVGLEMLPVGGDLFIVVADADCNLHVLQFDPERELFGKKKERWREMLIDDNRSQILAWSAAASSYDVCIGWAFAINPDSSSCHPNNHPCSSGFARSSQQGYEDGRLLPPTTHRQSTTNGVDHNTNRLPRPSHPALRKHVPSPLYPLQPPLQRLVPRCGDEPKSLSHR